jgi:hypothetical protein
VPRGRPSPGERGRRREEEREEERGRKKERKEGSRRDAPLVRPAPTLFYLERCPQQDSNLRPAV